MRYEYRVVPAPERGEKVKGVKAAEARFAASVERVMNDMAARGWEYLRSDTLPSEERSGLTSTQTVWRNLLVFRRPAARDAEVFEPRRLEPPSAPRETAAPPDPVGLADAGPGDPEDEGDPRLAVVGLPDALRARAQRLRSGR